jgi:uncharacterized protein
MRVSTSTLRRFLDGPTGSDLVGYDELRGFIVAVAGTPEVVPPSEWLPEAFCGEMPEFESEEQANAALQEVMELYNLAVQGVRRSRALAPKLHRDAISNLEEGAAIASWSRGFSRGYSWLREEWDEFLSEELERELASILLVLTFFSSRQMAEACHEETAGEKSLEEVAEIMHGTFDKAVVEYVRLGQSIYRARLEVEREAASVPAKVGRNELCPCGSGRKYKRCCAS